MRCNMGKQYIVIYAHVYVLVTNCDTTLTTWGASESCCATPLAAWLPKVYKPFPRVWILLIKLDLLFCPVSLGQSPNMALLGLLGLLGCVASTEVSVSSVGKITRPRGGENTPSSVLITCGPPEPYP